MNVWLMFVMVALTVEQLLLFAEPQILARLAFLPLALERAIELPDAPRASKERAGYREQAAEDVALPALPGRIDVGDAVLRLGGDGRSFGMRRAFGFWSRVIWLVRIDVERSGRTVRLRAKESFLPISFLGIAPLAADASGIGGAFGFLVLFGVVFVVNRAFGASSRDEALVRAYAAIERAFTATAASGDDGASS